MLADARPLQQDPMMSRSSDAMRDELMLSMPDYASEFGGTFANHAPMVLVALERMGGTPADMKRFFDFYRDFKKLPPFGKCGSEIGPDDWARYLGQRDFEPAYRRFFHGELARQGREAMLAEWLPRLAPGVGASAFHALMRAAYAIIQDEDLEVANALAYWCATWLQMPDQRGGAAISDNPVDVLRHVSGIASLREQPKCDLLWHAMSLSFGLPEFEGAGDWLALDEGTMPRCAEASLALFCATQDFAALHAVTGLHWIRVLAPYHDATALMTGYFWSGVAGLMGAMGMPVPPSGDSVAAWRDLPCPGWDMIFRAARQSLDEHDLSLTFSCAQEEAHYGDPLYRRAAARRLGLIPEMKGL